MLSMFTNMTCCIVQPNHAADCCLSSCKYFCPRDMLYFIFLFSKKVIMDNMDDQFTRHCFKVTEHHILIFSTQPHLWHMFINECLVVACTVLWFPCPTRPPRINDSQWAIFGKRKLPLHLIIHLYSVSPVLKAKEGRPSSPTFLLLETIAWERAFYDKERWVFPHPNCTFHITHYN